MWKSTLNHICNIHEHDAYPRRLHDVLENKTNDCGEGREIRIGMYVVHVCHCSVLLASACKLTAIACVYISLLNLCIICLVLALVLHNKSIHSSIATTSNHFALLHSSLHLLVSKSEHSQASYLQSDHVTQYMQV